MEAFTDYNSSLASGIDSEAFEKKRISYQDEHEKLSMIGETVNKLDEKLIAEKRKAGE